MTHTDPVKQQGSITRAQIVFAVSFIIFITLIAGSVTAAPPDHRALAVEAVKNGKPHQAMVSYHRALRDAPGDAELLLGLAKSYINLGHWDQAQQYVEQIPPDNWQYGASASMLRGRIALHQQQWQQAEHYYQQALAHKKTGAAYLGLAQARARAGDEQGAEAAYVEYNKLQGLEN